MSAGRCKNWEVLDREKMKKWSLNLEKKTGYESAPQNSKIGYVPPKNRVLGALFGELADLMWR